MEKSTFTREYRVLLQTLKDFRQKAKLSQVQLAEKLEQSQSFVSKCERGETRLDLVQLRVICQALRVSLPTFVAEFEDRLKKRH